MVASPGLGILDFDKMFHLYARDSIRSMGGVLAQEHGGKPQPVVFSQRWSRHSFKAACLRALASCALLVEMATSFTLRHPTTLHTTHNILVKTIHTHHMSAQWLIGYKIILLSDPQFEDQIRSFHLWSSP